jgi:hypothetical protein
MTQQKRVLNLGTYLVNSLPRMDCIDKAPGYTRYTFTGRTNDKKEYTITVCRDGYIQWMMAEISAGHLSIGELPPPEQMPIGWSYEKFVFVEPSSQ